MESGRSHCSACEITRNLHCRGQHKPEAMEISDLTRTYGQILKIVHSPQHWVKPSGHGDLTIIHHDIKVYHLIAQSEGISGLRLCQCSMNVLKLASIYLADLL